MDYCPECSCTVYIAAIALLICLICCLSSSISTALAYYQENLTKCYDILKDSVSTEETE